jgi:hypothetical protein
MHGKYDPGLMAGTFLWLGLALLVLLLSAVWALATTHYAGEWDNVDPATRSWFRNLRSPHGVPCCNMADGHRTLGAGRTNIGYRTRWLGPMVRLIGYRFRQRR